MMVRKDYILSVLEQTEEKEARFFAAWKQGVELLGKHLFGPKSPTDARNRDDLRPRRQLIEAELAKESCGEEQFLTAMVSFYDPAWGEELVDLIDCHKSFCGLIYNLDHEQIEILCELLRNYQGWPEPEARH
jgi:hypothetical protein